MLPGPAVPGSCLASFHFRWAIHPIRPVHIMRMTCLLLHERISLTCRSCDWRCASRSPLSRASPPCPPWQPAAPCSSSTAACPLRSPADPSTARRHRAARHPPPLQQWGSTWKGLYGLWVMTYRARYPLSCKVLLHPFLEVWSCCKLFIASGRCSISPLSDGTWHLKENCAALLFVQIWAKNHLPHPHCSIDPIARGYCRKRNAECATQVISFFYDFWSSD